ncbi:MAG: hypothetical protein KIS92_03225 [Planctomycetota bacterium]|nr:hypothetical protein [Planctomycetota bacterium]
MMTSRNSHMREAVSVSRAWKVGGLAKKEQEKAGWGNGVLLQLAARRFEGLGSAAILLQMVRLNDRWPLEKAQEADRVGVKLRDLPNLLAFDASPAERREMGTNPAIRQRVEKRLRLQQQVFAEIEAGELKGNQVRERVAAIRKQHPDLWPAGSQKLLALRDHRATRERTVAYLDALKSSKALLLRDAGKISPELQHSMHEQVRAIEGLLGSFVAQVALLDRQSDRND